jgi:hypothetical protein
MTFLMDNFWKFLFLAILLVGGWFFWERLEQKKEWELKVTAFADRLETAKFDAKRDPKEVHADYWTLLGKVKEFQEAVNADRIKPIQQKPKDDETPSNDPVSWLLEQAYEKVGFSHDDPATRLSRQMLMENLDTCKQMGVWDDPKNLDLMLEGKAPKPTKSPMGNEPLVLMNKVSPQFAWEGRNHPANLQVVPAPVAVLMGLEVDQELWTIAQRFANAGVIQKKSRDVMQRFFDHYQH